MLAGRRVVDLGVVFGGVVWLGVAAASLSGIVGVSLVGLYVSLAVLVLVPLGLGLANIARGSHALYRLAAWLQIPSALAVAAAFLFPRGSSASIALVVPWLAVTVLLGLYGLSRVVEGPGSLPDVAVSAAFLYVPVAGAALLLHRTEVFLGFPPVIILLTSIHYHYAGYVLPLIVGLTYRDLLADDAGYGGGVVGRVAAATTLVIILAIASIGLGITFSPVLEIVAVVLFTLAVTAFAVTTALRIAPHQPRPAQALLTLASASLVVTMSLALLYGYSAYPTSHTVFPGSKELVSIPRMILFHGTLNAFGFALPALLAHKYLASATKKPGMQSPEQ